MTDEVYEAALAELNELLEALRPFAIAAGHYSPEQPDGWLVARGVSIGHLRRARAVFGVEGAE
jgi:hypothetical protein